jgi:enoyl-CoA hydratase/carnithine racemase
MMSLLSGELRSQPRRGWDERERRHAGARVGRAAHLTINRPDQRNALSNEVFAELRAGLAEAKADPAVRAVVLAGAGDKAFCAGGDLRQMGEDGDELTPTAAAPAWPVSAATCRSWASRP